MDDSNKNMVIIKASARHPTWSETIMFWVLLLVFGVLALVSLVIVIEIIFSNTWAGIVQSLLGIVSFGGFSVYQVVCVIKGKVFAIISDEGIAVRGYKSTDYQLDYVIPWENIREARLVEGYRSYRVGFDYINKTGKECFVEIETQTSRYSQKQVLEIINKFKKKHKRSK